MTELLPRKAKRRIWSLRRRDGPKSRKLHQCELVGPTHVSPPNPRIKARFQRAALEPFGVSFSSIFLHEKKDGVPEGRRISREEGKNEKQNDCVPGGPTEKRMPVKTQPEQNSKTAPPEFTSEGRSQNHLKSYRK